jgi:hypothetical protein
MAGVMRLGFLDAGLLLFAGFLFALLEGVVRISVSDAQQRSDGGTDGGNDGAAGPRGQGTGQSIEAIRIHTSTSFRVECPR